MADLSNVRVDGTRLWDSLMEMAKIGATTKGGVNRLTLTDLDGQSRKLFRKWCEAAGCSVTAGRLRAAACLRCRGSCLTGSALIAGWLHCARRPRR